MKPSFRQIFCPPEDTALTHGMRNVNISDWCTVIFEGRSIKNVSVDRVRILGAECGVELKRCGVENLEWQGSDLDYTSIFSSSLINVTFKQDNLFGFTLGNCENIDGLSFEDCFWGIHVWNEASADENVTVYETRLEIYLPEGLRHVESPYVSGHAHYVSIMNNSGKNISIIRPVGGLYSLTIGRNKFQNFKMEGPGFLHDLRFENNVLVNSTIENMIFQSGNFSGTSFIDSSVRRSIFIGVSFWDSKIEMNPDLLSCRFSGCEFAQDLNATRFHLGNDALFYYQGKAIMGVMADPETGYLVPDLKAEQEASDPSEETLDTISMRKTIAGALSDHFQTAFPENPDIEYVHAGDYSEVIPFSTIYPALLEKALAEGLIDRDHPHYNGWNPQVSYQQDVLSSPESTND